DFSQLYRTTAFLVIIRHVIDPRADGIAPHQAGVVGFQEVGRGASEPTEATPLPRSRACPLSRTRLEANRPNRDRLSFRAVRKVRSTLLDLLLNRDQDGRLVRLRRKCPTASSRSPPDGDLSFFPVVQSAAVTCRLWCVFLTSPTA